MNQTKKKKGKWRRSVSVMLSAALMFSALPVSGAWAAEPEPVSSAPVAKEEAGESEAIKNPAVASTTTNQGVEYLIQQDDNGEDMISVIGLADNFSDFVTEDGEYTFPEEIEGVPVRYIGERGVSNGARIVFPEQVKKVVLPDTIVCWNRSICGPAIKEIYIYAYVSFPGEGFESESQIPTSLIAVDYDNVSLDVYAYLDDWEDADDADERWIANAELANSVVESQAWKNSADHPVTIHLRSQQIADLYTEYSGAAISSGKLIIKDGLVYPPSMALKIKIRDASKLAESDYTKGSWEALSQALANAKELGGDAEDEAINSAISALDAATESLVSLEGLKAALALATEKDKELYTTATWTALQQAVEAAGRIADDISTKDLASVTQAVMDAIDGLKECAPSTLTITCADVQAPAKPDPQVTQNTSGGEVTFEYSSSDTFRYPETKAPRDAGTYYVRAHSARTDEYAEAVSEPVQFNIAAAPAQGEGYSLDGESGVLTITDPGLIENCAELGDAPWYSLRADIKSIRVQPAGGVSHMKIGTYAFGGMSYTESMELPEGIEEICDNAFSGMTSLKTMELPAGIKKFGENAFYNCHEWESTVTLEGITAGKEAFYRCEKLQGIVTLADDTKEIPDSLFYGCSKLNSEAEDYPLPAQAERIGEMSFWGTTIRTLKMPAQLKEIGEGAFRNSGLTAIAIPESVELIEKRFVTGSARLEYVEFENTGYTEENIMLTKETRHIAFEGDYNTEGTFEGLPHTAAILCDGETYDLLAPCAGYYEITYFGTPMAVGWPASILHRTGEYIGGYAEEIRASLEASEKFSQADYSAEAWEALQQAQAEAAELIGKGETNYEKRKNSAAARDRLATGIRACLKSLQESTKAMAEGSQAEDYDQEADSWYDLGDAMEDAEKLLGEENPTLEDLLEAIAVLKKAVGNLDYSPLGEAKAALDTAIAGAADKNEADYTPESWKAYQEAISEAQGARKTGILEQMEAAAEKVSQAEKALEKKVVPTAEPSSGPSTSASPEPGASQTPQPSKTPGVNPTATPDGQGGAQKTTPAPKVKKATIKKAKSPKKKTLQVQWIKISGVTGYQVQIATNKKFTKNKKTYTVKKAATNKKTIKKLKRKKTYYIRVRAYRTIKGKKYYGSWSKVKKAKIK